MSKPSSILIERFHQILVWPLCVKQARTDESKGPTASSERWTAAKLAKQIEQDTAGAWRIASGSDVWGTARADTPARADCDDRDFLRYSEAVYFHPFIRDLLYPMQEDSPTRVLQRKDVRKVRVEIGKDVHVLDMRRALLFVFDTGVAILAVEVKLCAQPAEGGNDENGTLTLQQGEDLLDCLRCAYPAFWKAGALGKPAAGHAPQLVEWLNAKGEAIGTSNYEKQDAFIDCIVKPAPSDRLLPKAASHWRGLFEKPPTKPGDPMFTFDKYFEQVEDERIPTMGYLGMSDPTSLTRGDFARLCFLDEQGSSETMPYSPAFLKDFEAVHAYDRYWAGSEMPPGTDYAAWKSMANYQTTRYLVSGYGFVVVGKSGNSFFNNDDSGGLAHFRNHYFKMFIIAHMQKASLLAFSDRLAKVAEDASQNRDDVESLHKRLSEVRLDFTLFTSRDLHTEISNQEQARELYAMMRRTLGIDPLAAELLAEIDALEDVAETQMQRDQTKAATGLSKATFQLSWVLGGATILALWSQAFTVWEKSLQWWFCFAFASLGTVLFAGWLIWPHARKR